MKKILLIFIILISTQISFGAVKECVSELGNSKMDSKHNENLKFHYIGLNPVSPFASIFNVSYGLRIIDKKREFVISTTYIKDLSLEGLLGLTVFKARINAVIFSTTYRKYRNRELKGIFYGTGMTCLHVLTEKSDYFLIIPVECPSGCYLPKSFDFDIFFAGVNFEAGYTMYFFHKILSSISFSVAPGCLIEKSDRKKFKYIINLVWIPSLNYTIGWLF